MQANFAIRNCCGDLMARVTLSVPSGFMEDTYDRGIIDCAIAEAGLVQHTCAGCGDRAYNVETLDVFV
jgi:hypothetical protein